MKKLLLIAVVLLTTGCATTWQGRSESDLIGSLGIPTRTMNLQEGTAYEYVKCDSTGMIVPVGNLLVTSNGSCSRQVFLIKDHTVSQVFNKKWE